MALKTACGWKWPRSNAAEPVLAGAGMEGMSVCGRCVRHFDMLALPRNVAELVDMRRSQVAVGEGEPPREPYVGLRAGSAQH